MDRKTIIKIAKGVVVILGIWSSFWIIPYYFDHVHRQNDIINYWDISFAAATALFTGIAFTVAYISLYQQNKGLKHQVDLDVFSETVHLILASERFFKSKSYLYSESYYYDMSKLRRILNVADSEKIKVDDFRALCTQKIPPDGPIKLSKESKRKLRISLEKITFFCERMEYLGFMTKKNVAQSFIIEYYSQTIEDSYNIISKHLDIISGNRYPHYIYLYNQAIAQKKK